MIFNKKLWFIPVFVFAFGMVLIITQKVPIPDSENDCLKVEGVVLNIFEGGVKDANFKLMGHDRVYYFNRALENGMDLEEVKKKLLNQTVTIYYPEHKTLFGSKTSSKHACVLKFQGETIYTELD